MPLALVLLFFLVEGLAFYGLVTLIGIGWALLILVGLMLVSGLAAMNQLRSVTALSAQGRIGAGRLAGDIGLLMIGALLGVTPGIVTSVVGLLLIFGPTRGFVRGFAKGKLLKSAQNYGIRMYSNSPMAKNHTQYGHFVIDEDPDK